MIHATKMWFVFGYLWCTLFQFDLKLDLDSFSLVIRNWSKTRSTPSSMCLDAGTVSNYVHYKTEYLSNIAYIAEFQSTKHCKVYAKYTTKPLETWGHAMEILCLIRWDCFSGDVLCVRKCDMCMDSIHHQLWRKTTKHPTNMLFPRVTYRPVRSGNTVHFNQSRLLGPLLYTTIFQKTTQQKYRKLG